MAAINRIPNIHSMAGARWLAPFLLIVAATLIAGWVMIVYPYVSR
jgi:hypothetical protein